MKVIKTMDDSTACKAYPINHYLTVLEKHPELVRNCCCEREPISLGDFFSSSQNDPAASDGDHSVLTAVLGAKVVGIGRATS